MGNAPGLLRLGSRQRFKIMAGHKTGDIDKYIDRGQPQRAKKGKGVHMSGEGSKT